MCAQGSRTPGVSSMFTAALFTSKTGLLIQRDITQLCMTMKLSKVNRSPTHISRKMRTLDDGK